jgi:hypothetical protein
MDASREREHLHAFETASDQCALVAGDLRDPKARDLSERDPDRLLDLIGKCTEPRSEHERELRRGRTEAAAKLTRHVGGSDGRRRRHVAPMS